MTWANPNAPNLPDYVLFTQGVMGISTVYLPATSPFLGYAFIRAMQIVLNVPTSLAGIVYTLAVYNCAGHIQLTITPDQVVNGVSYTFFQDQRRSQDLLKTVQGVVASTSDQASSSAFATPDGLAQLTIEDLGFMRTVWGREYLAYAQSFGPTVWGLS